MKDAQERIDAALDKLDELRTPDPTLKYRDLVEVRLLLEGDDEVDA